MRYFIFVLIGFAFVSASPGFAKSCSDRKQVCFGYCDKANRGPKCKSVCEGYMNTCMATGCWESKIVSKQCDFTPN
jgi:hypothetical protein